MAEPKLSERAPQRWLSVRRERGMLERVTAIGGVAAKTSKHRTRDAKGTGGLAVYDLDKPRCREATRSVGPLGPEASRAPSV